MVRFGTVWYVYGMVRYDQTIYTVNYGTVTVRCKRLEIAYFLQQRVNFKCCDLQISNLKLRCIF